MSYLISSTAIDNLGHELNEIRIRSLKHIEGKILRAFQQRISIEFDSGKMISNLISWFNRKPFIEVETVLNLILTILKSDHIHKVIKYLKKQRIEKEINKIYQLVEKSVLYKDIVSNIKNVLENYVEPVNSYDDTISSLSDSVLTAGSENNCIQNQCNENDDFINEYEEVWSTPSVSDVSSLNLLHNSISCSSTFDEIRNGLIFLKTAINDYPAEYFLQPPYIFKNMIKLYFREKSTSTLLIKNLNYLTKAIVLKADKRKLAECYDPSGKDMNTPSKSKTQITLSRYCGEVLKVCVDYLKEFNENIDQNDIFLIYQLITVVFELMESKEYRKYSHLILLKSTLIDLGVLARFYRQEKNYRIHRIQYILIIYIITKLVQLQNLHVKNSNNVSDSFDSRNKNSLEIKPTEIWFLELQYAVLDYPLQKFHPIVYNEIDMFIKNNVKQISEIETLFSSENIFKPAIEVLKKAERIKDDELIILSTKALDTLSIYQSLAHVRKLIEAISRSMYLFNNNSNLKEASEDIILRLIAHENINIQRIAYKEISSIMKQNFGSLMSGDTNIRNFDVRYERIQSLGIPLTSNIISELICFGCTNQDLSIKQNSEVILSLILKSKDVLTPKWKDMLEILIPNFPLLQCLANNKDNFGKLIIELFNPDKGLENLELIKGNIRFLFNSDEEIRLEAVSRLVYILSNDSSVNEYLPNMLEIFEILPNNLCYLQTPRDPEKIFYGGLYDCTTITALIELLKSNDVEPNIRKTCLMQLNVLCQDMDLNKMIFDQNGWFYAMQILENSLKKYPTTDHPDSAVPAISTLSKIILCNSFFRQELCDEVNVYVLLLRALFLFFSDITLQQDAVIALFLLLYSHQIIGSGKRISVPLILQSIGLPLKCDFHSMQSSFTRISPIEKIYLEFAKNDQNSITTDLYSGSKTLNNSKSYQREKFSSIPLSRRSEPIYSVVREKTCNENISYLQYIRFSFANSWFCNVDEIYKQIKLINLDDDKATLDYSIFPGNCNEIAGVIEIFDILDFNQGIKMNSEDIRLIKITSPVENLKKFLKKISNATTESDFLKNLANLRFCLFLGGYKCLDGNAVLIIFKRYLTVKPYSKLDYTIFLNAIEFFEYLIKSKNEVIFTWILQEFAKQQCLLLDILRDYNAPVEVYDAVCKLIETVIYQCTHMNHNNEVQELILAKREKDSVVNYNLYNKLLEHMIPITEECFHKRHLEQVRSLVNTIQTITQTNIIEIDFEFANIIVKKLLYFVMALKLFGQGGSHLNKNCLLIVGNLMDIVDGLILDENHVKLCSGLCSHEDFEIRALAWCILSKISLNLHGAHILVKELSYLPGGFHACCVSTLLDPNEIAVIRSTAGTVFANLLSHRTTNSQGSVLHQAVIPLCVELEPSIENNGSNLVKQIFSKYSFFSAILHSLEHVCMTKTLEYRQNNEIITPDIISAYCRILHNYIGLCSDTASEEFDSEILIIRIFSLVKLVPSCISKESLTMLSEICRLFNQLHSIESIRLIKKNLSSDYSLIVVLVQIIDPQYFDNYNVHHLIHILQTVRYLINETASFEIICEILTYNGSLNLVNIIVNCLQNSKNTDLQNTGLTFLISSFVKGENVSTEKFKTIAALFDSVSYTKSADEFASGSEIIFNCVAVLFERIFQKKKNCFLLKKTIICEALAVLLKYSKNVRALAQQEHFMDVILNQINGIFENITTSCTDYIRKYGDSKKEKILQELTILYSIILHWFSSDCLTNNSVIEKFSKVVLQTWQWINHSEALREIFLKTLAVVSEDSLQVCKQFAASITSFSNSIIQLTVKMVIAETNKIKHPSIDFGILELGLGILMNCCCCIEGRLLLLKMNVLDVIGNLHPIDVKVQKNWNIVTMYWLEFWNIFSRYQEGANAKHLYILCSFISKANSTIRSLCLKILQHMAFFQINRANLLSSQDFQYTVKDILENGSLQEKYIVIVTLWKLASENFKSKHIIKNWNLQNKLKYIQQQIPVEDKENDLYSATDILLNLLK